MSDPIRVTTTTVATYEITVEQLASIFCELNDEQMAQFFIECAKLEAAWPEHPYGRFGQWWLVGRHLRTCACSTDDARAMINEIATAITYADAEVAQ